MARWPYAFVFLTLGGLAGALVHQATLQGQATETPAIPKEMTSYRDVVKKVLPAVVSVEALPKAVAKKDQPKTNQRRRPRIEDFPGLPEQFRKFFEELPDGQFETPEDMVPQHSFGSGVIIDAKGIVLTNYHVVAGAGRARITLKDGRKFESSDIKGDRKNDLAIVRIKADAPLPFLEMGDSDAMEIGDRVLAVGAPFGLTGSVTAGIISAKGRTGLNAERVVYEDYLQTDAAINPGNSGGPLVNLAGQVIGINTAIKTRTGGFQGVGLAITSNLAKNIVEQLIKEGVVHRGYLGVLFKALDPEVAAQMGLKDKVGVVVSRVVEGAPAAKAGIQDGDVLTAVAGKPITDSRELQRLVASLPLHKPVDVTVIRDGKTKIIPVTIEEQPEHVSVAGRDQEPSSPPPDGKEEIGLEKLGLTLSELTPELAKKYGYAENAKGAVVTEVQRDSAAAESRLAKGMLISKIDGKPVSSASAAKDLLEKGRAPKGHVLQVHYPESLGGGTDYIVIKPETVEK